MELFGLDKVLFKNLEIDLCPECGEELVSIPNHSAVMCQLREKLCFLKRLLTGREFSFLREALGLNGQAFALLAKTTNVSVSRWETSAVDLNPQVDQIIRTFTLIDLGKSKDILVMLGDIERIGIDEVSIDMADYKGFSYRYETCHNFGGRGDDRAWVINNTSDQAA